MLQWYEVWPVLYQWYMEKSAAYQTTQVTTTTHVSHGENSIYKGMALDSYMRVIRFIFNKHVDRNGKVQKVDFGLFARDIVKAQTGQNLNFDGDTQEILKKWFLDLDENGDGVLEWHEVDPALKKFYYENAIGDNVWNTYSTIYKSEKKFNCLSKNKDS